MNRRYVPPVRIPLGREVEAVMNVHVGIGAPEIDGSGVTTQFGFNREFDFEFEDSLRSEVNAAIRKTIKGVLGGLPPGSLMIVLDVVLPDNWRQAGTSLKQKLAYAVSESMRDALPKLMEKQ